MVKLCHATLCKPHSGGSQMFEAEACRASPTVNTPSVPCMRQCFTSAATQDLNAQVRASTMSRRKKLHLANCQLSCTEVICLCPKARSYSPTALSSLTASISFTHRTWEEFSLGKSCAESIYVDFLLPLAAIPELTGGLFCGLIRLLTALMLCRLKRPYSGL